MRLRLILSRFFPTLVIACLGAAAFAAFTPSTALAQDFARPTPIATSTPRVMIDPTTLEFSEGSSRSYDVSLEADPGQAVTVGITKSGSSGITVDPTSVVFAEFTWDTPHRVTVRSEEDDDVTNDDSATMSHRVTTEYDDLRAEDVIVNVTDITDLPTFEEGIVMIPVPGGTARVGVIRESGVPENMASASEMFLMEVFRGTLLREVTEDLLLTFKPPDSDAIGRPGRFGLGDEPGIRTVVDITVDGTVPPGGIRVCLPVTQGLRTEAGEGRELNLLRFDSTMGVWEEVPESTDERERVCANVKDFSLFAVGYDKQRVERRDLKMVLAGVGRTIASDAVEVLSGRFGASAGSQPKVTVGGQMLRLTGGKEGETVKQVTNVAVRVARMFGVTGGANGRTPEGTGDAAALSRHPGLFDGGTGRTNWRAPVRMRNVSVKDVLARSAFELPLSRTEDGGATGLVLWGRGMASNFSGSPDTGFSMDGDLYGGYVGLDYRLDPKVMLGLAVSHTNGEVDYEVTRPSNRAKVGLDLQLTSVLPYARWQPYDGLGVWGMFGAGWGEMDMDVAGLDQNQTTDLTLVMGALGGRHALISWNGIDFAAKADAFRSTLRSQGKGEDLPSARGNAGRMRLLVEGRTEYMISSESRLQPRLEVGGRWDTGDAEKGIGAEVGGGVAYTHTELGLAVEAQGRYLLAHQEEAFEDWGASLKVRMDPGIRGQGFWLSMAPVWGRPSTGAERLWGSASGAPMVLDSSRDRSRRSGWAPGQLEMDFGYGMAMSNNGLVTPYGGLAFGRSGAARYRFGSWFKLNTVLGLRVEGEREEQAGGLVSHGVMTRLDWQW